MGADCSHGGGTISQTSSVALAEQCGACDLYWQTSVHDKARAGYSGQRNALPKSDQLSPKVDLIIQCAPLSSSRVRCISIRLSNRSMKKMLCFRDSLARSPISGVHQTSQMITRVLVNKPSILHHIFRETTIPFRDDHSHGTTHLLRPRTRWKDQQRNLFHGFDSGRRHPKPRRSPQLLRKGHPPRFRHFLPHSAPLDQSSLEEEEEPLGKLLSSVRRETNHRSHLLLRRARRTC